MQKGATLTGRCRCGARGRRGTAVGITGCTSIMVNALGLLLYSFERVDIHNQSG